MAKVQLIQPVLDYKLIDGAFAARTKRAYDRQVAEFIKWLTVQCYYIITDRHLDIALSNYFVYTYKQAYPPAAGCQTVAGLLIRFPYLKGVSRSGGRRRK